MPTPEPTTEPPTGPVADGPAAFDIRITSGAPTSEEIAAVTAVLSAALEELANVHSHRSAVRSAWARSQRSLREPLVPGTWTSF
jgi:hypothetical protein